MSNISEAVHTSMERWLQHPALKRGFLSIYNNEPFNDTLEISQALGYEIGRQIAVVAKANGYKTKGKLIRKVAKSERFDWVKTNKQVLIDIVYSLNNNLAI